MWWPTAGRCASKARREGHGDLEIVLNPLACTTCRTRFAAIAVASEIGVEDTANRQLAQFKGSGGASSATERSRCRRSGAFTLVDDYGHHPAEMAATIAAVRGAFPAAPGAGVPAASLHAHARLFRRLRQVLSTVTRCCSPRYAVGEGRSSRDGRRCGATRGWRGGAGVRGNIARWRFRSVAGRRRGGDHGVRVRSGRCRANWPKEAMHG